jgi:TolB-like protein/Tfp pilus assembly protein PilF
MEVWPQDARGGLAAVAAWLCPFGRCGGSLHFLVSGNFHFLFASAFGSAVEDADTSLTRIMPNYLVFRKQNDSRVTRSSSRKRYALFVGGEDEFVFRRRDVHHQRNFVHHFMHPTIFFGAYLGSRETKSAPPFYPYIMSGFFEELQRRKVYRVAAAYIVAAGFLIQIASAAFPAWELPNWSLRLVITLLLIGFPIALILAWAYDITAQGIQITPTKGAHRRRNLILLIATGVIVSASAGFFLLPRAVWHKIDKSVAVLPFQNLSSDPENAYFADGIQDEVLTRLAKIADLKVISRTSTQQYQSEPGNLSEIAKQLGVTNILEGSVQKAADQVRVNVRLVNVQTGSQLWAETYDRKLSDIFVIESEIAKGIVESLQAKLTGREEQALAAKPTNNPEAYDAYLRGLAFEARSNYSSDALFKAIDYYGLAVQLDPNFALAWARLSFAHALLYFNRGDATAARRDAAKGALENAQKLQPNTPETLLFTGYYQYWVLHDYGLAKATFGRVSKMFPGNSDVLYALGAVTRREGLWDESVAYWERGLALDPQNTALLIEVAWTYAALRQFPTAEKLYDRALAILPNELSLMALKASIYQAEGNLQEAAKSLVQVNAQTNSDAAVRIKLAQLRLERNYTEATQLGQARQARLQFTFGIDKGIRQVGLALLRRVAGDIASAKAAAEQARNTLEPLRKDQPDNAFVAAALAVAYAMLDEKGPALNEAQRAIALVPSSKDRLSGPAFEENLALVEMIIGENSRAISTLARLLQTPYGGWLYNPAPITPALLKLDPIWDPLRTDPAFEKLCEEKQP